MDKKLKAFQVREPDEGCCCIVFAQSNVVARRQGADELNIDFSEVDECKRAPWADEYAPGPVPVEALISAGWWYDCACGCGRRIDSEGGNADDGDENPMVPVYVPHGVYWNQKCIDAEAKHRRQQEDAKARDQAEAESAVLAKFPFATDIKAGRSYASVDGKVYRHNTLVARFAFPGGRFRVDWVVGAKVVQVQRDDHKLWLSLHPEPEAVQA